jgi:hypothetical protein
MMDEKMWDKMTKPTPLFEMVNEKLLPNVTKIEKNIWVVSNFISEEDRKFCIDYAESLEEEAWWEKDKWWKGKIVELEKNSPVKILFEKISKELQKYLLDGVFIGTRPFGSLHRLTEGQSMFLHTDNPTKVREYIDEHGNVVGETSGDNNYCLLAIILYLSDFNGGELHFPRLKIKYKANPGDLLLWSGAGEDYDHEVLPVLPGPNRYITTGFGYSKEGI